MMTPEDDILSGIKKLLSEGSKKRRREIADGSTNDDENSDSDIVEINVSGEFFTTTFGTFRQVEDSTLTMMFRKPWFDSLVRDRNGRVFLNFDPDHFKIIIRFLRMKMIEDPFDPTEAPTVPSSEKRNFDRLLQYLGLFDLLYRTVFRSLDVKHGGITILLYDNLNKSHGKAERPNITSTDDKKEISFTTPDRTRDHFYCDTLFQPSSFDLGSLRDGLVWKVKINSLTNTCGLYLLIIRNDKKNNQYYEDHNVDSRRCYGWKMKSPMDTKVNTPKTGGRPTIDLNNTWMGFHEGECLYFRMERSALTMRSALYKNSTFAISDIPKSTNSYALRFVFLFPETHLGTRATARTTTITLESLKGEEAERIFMDNQKE